MQKCVRLKPLSSRINISRSGEEIATNKRRRTRSRSGLREGVICTAAMKVYVLPDGKVDMTYFPEHWGHTGDIRLFLSKEQRQEIARRLNSGNDPDEIVQECSRSDNPRLRAVDRHTVYRVSSYTNHVTYYLCLMYESSLYRECSLSW